MYIPVPINSDYIFYIHILSRRCKYWIEKDENNSNDLLSMHLKQLYIMLTETYIWFFSDAEKNKDAALKAAGAQLMRGRFRHEPYRRVINVPS